MNTPQLACLLAISISFVAPCAGPSLVAASTIDTHSSPPASESSDVQSHDTTAPGTPRTIPTVRLDPEKPIAILGWWGNGAQLLEVAADGSYRLFDTQNRYRKPVEVGRWHRQNHATFWLEPYTMRKDDRTRVPLSIVDDEVVINVRTLKAMRFLDQPPLSQEDLVIGLWAGAGGSLDLQSSMRYHYVAPRTAVEGQPVVISSHRGEWRFREGRIELLPDSPSVSVMVLEPEMPAAPTKKSAAKPEASGSKPIAADADASPASPPVVQRLHSVEGILERVEKRQAPNSTPAAPTAPVTPSDATPRNDSPARAPAPHAERSSDGD